MKGVAMQTVTTSEIKQNSTILQNALKDDMLVTRRDKPFVVVLDYERYLELIAKSQKQKQQNWIDETFGVIVVADMDLMIVSIAVTNG